MPCGISTRTIYSTCHSVPILNFRAIGQHDTHLGSGSSRIVAFKLGFDFYATEIDTEYFESQEKRFRSECFGEIKTKKGTLVQTSLFDHSNN